MKTLPPENDGMVLFVLTILLLVISWPTVILRFWIRAKKHTVGLDDWLMGLGLLMTTALSAILFIYCLSGAGYSPNDERFTPEIMARALKYYFIGQSFYCPSTIPIKISICVSLLRITGTHSIYKWSLYAIMVITTVSGLGSMLGIILSCTPPEAFWNPSAGTCNAVVNTFAAYFISACSILTDFALAVLPAFMLREIQMRRSLKFSVAIILGFAAFASCAVIVRLKYLMALLDSLNFVQESAKIVYWTVLELMIGIFAGSTPALRPLLNRLPFFGSSNRHGYSDEGAGRSSNKNHNHPGSELVTFGGTGAVQVRHSHPLEDGNSEEYILQGGEEKSKGIRRHISVTVESSASSEHGIANRPYYTVPK